MGTVTNISLNSFPKQGSWLNKRVIVFFHFNRTEFIHGIIVRDDE